MDLDHDTLAALREHHPAWRLLAAQNAPLVASFLHRVFIAPNVRELAEPDLIEALNDELFALRERNGSDAYPKRAEAYLNDWASPERGWLRKYYASGTDEPHLDLTPASEKAISWLSNLRERSFVGTESRLLTLIELLRQMSEGSLDDPEARIAQLERRRQEIDDEIARVASGQVALLDDTALRDRFQQFTQLARDLLADFREVEHNFRMLDRKTREEIALWDGSKGQLLEQVMGQHDAIAQSDQGRNFAAFWDFLMSGERQQELTDLLDHILSLGPIAALGPDPRTRRLHYDWLDAGEYAQRTVAQLSKQLRRFLDDQVWLENRRIMELLHNIESTAVKVRQQPPTGEIMAIDGTSADLALPIERPLAAPPQTSVVSEITIDVDDEAVDTSALYSQIVVDKAALSRTVRKALQNRSQVTLGEICAENPVDKGLAEIVAYLELAGTAFESVVDDSVEDTITWHHESFDGTTLVKRAHLPRVIFMRMLAS